MGREEVMPYNYGTRKKSLGHFRKDSGHISLVSVKPSS